MVAARGLPSSGSDANDAAHYEELQESWPAQRPSRKKRGYRRKRDRRVEVSAKRRERPSASRMSKALLAAQREIARTQAEADAAAEVQREAPDAGR